MWSQLEPAASGDPTASVEHAALEPAASEHGSETSALEPAASEVLAAIITTSVALSLQHKAKVCTRYVTCWHAQHRQYSFPNMKEQ